MPKATEKAKCEQCTLEQDLPEEFSEQEETSSEQDPDGDQEVIISPPQATTSAFIPYIEGAKMDWTVNDILYNGFIKWKIKCENILQCKLAMLSESRKCKKWWHGQEILLLTNTYHGTYPQKKCAWK